MSIRGVRGQPESDIRDVTEADLRGDRTTIRISTEGITLRGEKELLRTNFGEIVQELAAHLEDLHEDSFIQNVKESYEGYAAVNRDTDEVIAHASSSHNLTDELLSMDYDDESTVIVRCYE